jgi:DNA-binding GntR family transcriptional regulator
MLMRGELRPGEKINEKALCTRFGVSRTPLREALKVLASNGLVILAPNRGARVARISPEKVDQLFPILGALEALAGELACERISDSEIEAISKMHEAMLNYYRLGNAPEYLKLNRAIHEAIFIAARNAELFQLYQEILVRTHLARFTAQKSPARWKEAVEDHIAIMAALAARNGPMLSCLLKEHLRHKAGMVHESLARVRSETLD